MCVTAPDVNEERESIELQNQQSGLKVVLTQLSKHKNLVTTQLYSGAARTISTTSSFPGLEKIELWIDKVGVTEDYVKGVLQQSNQEIQRSKGKRSKRGRYSIYEDLRRVVSLTRSEVDRLIREQPDVDDIIKKQQQLLREQQEQQRLLQQQQEERQLLLLQQQQSMQTARTSESKSLLYSQSSARSASFGNAYGYSKSAFTFEELRTATDNFKEGNILGEGGYGTIYMGILPNKKVVAVKKHKSVAGERFEIKFFAEIEAISRIHHRNIVTLVGYCFTETEKILVYEFVSNKNLAFHLHGAEKPTMDWLTRRKIAIGCAKGLAYLHEDCRPAIIHRDIKSSNILLDDTFEAKVADFGLVKYFIGTTGAISTGVAGTFGYMDHEYASTGKVTIKSDVYSFGVVLLELITGRLHVDPHLTYPQSSLVAWARPLLKEAIRSGNYDALVDPKLGNNYDRSEMADMIKCAAACVRKSAEYRPITSQIVRTLEGAIPELPDLGREIDTTEEDLIEIASPGFNKAINGSTTYYSMSKSSHAQNNAVQAPGIDDGLKHQV